MFQPAQKHLRLPELTVDDLPQSTSASPRSSAASPRSSAVNDFDVSSSPATKRRAVICDDRPFAVDVGNESDDVDDDSAELEGRKPVIGNFGVYQLVVDQATLVERLLHDFSGHLIVLKTWLSVHTPPTVDGQNMDVAVLTLAAVMLATAKVSARGIRWTSVGSLLKRDSASFSRRRVFIIARCLTCRPYLDNLTVWTVQFVDFFTIWGLGNILIATYCNIFTTNTNIYFICAFIILLLDCLLNSKHMYYLSSSFLTSPRRRRHRFYHHHHDCHN